MNFPDLASRIIPVLSAALPGLQAVYVFGSVAREQGRHDSDVDLAFLTGRAVDPVARWHVQERLASTLGRDVDLVDLQSASTVMRIQVIGEGLVLVDIDPSARAFFEAMALSDFSRLQDERKGILEDVLRRGHVYG